ncbi:MAG TPA: RidA family protein [Candidatus Binatia bacterium]|jgi:2-iminobutanoate/2-iminopropanoate deaminase
MSKTEEKRTAIKTTNAPGPGGHYSQAIAAGGRVYVSGSGPFDPHTHKIVGADIAAQTRQTLKNIGAILEAAGASLKDVVKVTVYLRNIGDFDAMDKAYKEFFPVDPPARTTVEVGLYGAERLLAVDAEAVKP